VEDISVDKVVSDTSMTEAEATDSDSDSSVDIQTLQWTEVKNSIVPHSTEHMSRA
jgi:hypothetical protein